MVLTFFIIAFFSASIIAQEYSEEQMQELYEMMNPGAEHDMLKQYEGDWALEYEYRMEIDKKPLTSPGEGKIEMILGNRFMKWSSKGELMGQQVESLMILGFDKRIKKFTIYGFDTMGTYAVSAQGEQNSETGIITFEGTNYEPAFNKEMRYQMRFNTNDKDKIDFAVLFESPDGKKFLPVVQVSGTRKE
jgi:hypothetical protein